MSIDIERIVNGTPDKRIINAYNTLKMIIQKKMLEDIKKYILTNQSVLY